MGRVLVDEVSGWLRVYDDGSVDRTWTGPCEYTLLSSPAPASEEFIDGVATRDVVVQAETGLAVRIYLPENTNSDRGKLPVLIHFHGGGFCISQADWYLYYHFYSRLVRSARAICVSVYLRRAPEHRLPAALEDGLSALRWLCSLSRAELSEPWLQSHADFTRVFLIGDSTGGTLVHSVAARAAAEEASPVRISGAIPIHGGFLRERRSRSEEMTENESPFFTREMIDKFITLALPGGMRKDHPITWPMSTPLPELKLPPFLVVIADQDLLYDTQMEYVEALRAAGKEVEVLIGHGVRHCFYLNKVAVDSDPHTAAQTDFLISRVSQFITKH